MWCEFCKEAGYETNTEVMVPRWWEERLADKGKKGGKKKGAADEDEAHKEKKDEWIQTKMDIVATPQTGGCKIYIDVTYRHALATSHQVPTSKDAYHCIKEAESDKAKRYKPSHGRFCTTLACLTSGLMSRQCERTLGLLASAAQAKRSMNGLCNRRFLHNWRLKLSRHAAAWQSEAVELSIGRPHEKAVHVKAGRPPEANH